MQNVLCQNLIWSPMNILFTKELICFGLEISVIYEVLANFELKIQTRKIHKDFWTISSFYVSNCSNIFNMLFTKRIETSGFEGISTHFGYKGIRTICPKKTRQEKLIKVFELYHAFMCQTVVIFTKFIRILNHIKSLCIIFCAKLF